MFEQKKAVVFGTLMNIGSRKIVGWAMADHMETSLIEETLKHALSVRKPAKGWIHHSDQGSQYTSQDYTQLLEKEAAQYESQRQTWR